MHHTQASPTNTPGYFKRYTDQVTEDNVLAALESQASVIKEVLAPISEQKSTYAYGPGKWTIKEVLLHLSDAERIFCYRALCFARGEQAVLPSFDENGYADHSHANERSWQSLFEEFEAVRKHTLVLFKTFSQSAMATTGKAGTNILTVETVGFITAGHFNHHINILKERYL